MNPASPGKKETKKGSSRMTALRENHGRNKASSAVVATTTEDQPSNIKKRKFEEDEHKNHPLEPQSERDESSKNTLQEEGDDCAEEHVKEEDASTITGIQEKPRQRGELQQEDPANNDDEEQESDLSEKDGNDDDDNDNDDDDDDDDDDGLNDPSGTSHGPPHSGSQQLQSSSLPERGSGGVKKRKRTLYKKAPQAPRRFKSAYMFFSTDKHKEIREQLGERGVSEKTTTIAKLVSQAWKALGDEERSRYEELARKDKARFEVEKTLYTGPWKVPAKKKSHKDPNAPKRPMSAFLSYSHAMRARVKRENPKMSNAEISRLLAQKWKTASEEEKKEYVDVELKLRQKYLTDIAEWRENNERELMEQRRQREEYAMKAVSSGNPGSFLASSVPPPSILSSSIMDVDHDASHGGTYDEHRTELDYHHQHHYYPPPPPHPDYHASIGGVGATKTRPRSGERIGTMPPVDDPHHHHHAATATATDGDGDGDDEGFQDMGSSSSYPWASATTTSGGYHHAPHHHASYHDSPGGSSASVAYHHYPPHPYYSGYTPYSPYPTTPPLQYLATAAGGHDSTLPHYTSSAGTMMHSSSSSSSQPHHYQYHYSPHDTASQSYYGAYYYPSSSYCYPPPAAGPTTGPYSPSSHHRDNSGGTASPPSLGGTTGRDRAPAMTASASPSSSPVRVVGGCRNQEDEGIDENFAHDDHRRHRDGGVSEAVVDQRNAGSSSPTRTNKRAKKRHRLSSGSVNRRTAFPPLSSSSRGGDDGPLQPAPLTDPHGTYGPYSSHRHYGYYPHQEPTGETTAPYDPSSYSSGDPRFSSSSHLQSSSSSSSRPYYHDSSSYQQYHDDDDDGGGGGQEKHNDQHKGKHRERSYSDRMNKSRGRPDSGYRGRGDDDDDSNNQDFFLSPPLLPPPPRRSRSSPRGQGEDEHRYSSSSSPYRRRQRRMTSSYPFFPSDEQEEEQHYGGQEAEPFDFRLRGSQEGRSNVDHHRDDIVGDNNPFGDFRHYRGDHDHRYDDDADADADDDDDDDADATEGAEGGCKGKGGEQEQNEKPRSRDSTATSTASVGRAIAKASPKRAVVAQESESHRLPVGEEGGGADSISSSSSPQRKTSSRRWQKSDMLSSSSHDEGTLNPKNALPVARVRPPAISPRRHLPHKKKMKLVVDHAFHHYASSSSNDGMAGASPHRRRRQYDMNHHHYHHTRRDEGGHSHSSTGNMGLVDDTLLPPWVDPIDEEGGEDLVGGDQGLASSDEKDIRKGEEEGECEEEKEDPQQHSQPDHTGGSHPMQRRSSSKRSSRH